MNSILRLETRVALKPHRCWGCLQPIRPGDQYEFMASVDMGSVCNSHWCMACVEYMATGDSYDDDLISEGDLRERLRVQPTIKPAADDAAAKKTERR